MENSFLIPFQDNMAFSVIFIPEINDYSIALVIVEDADSLYPNNIWDIDTYSPSELVVSTTKFPIVHSNNLTKGLCECKREYERILLKEEIHL